MNPDWLLKHFEQISEAPDAIPRLRRFILDLAVRGKLVEQNPEDEPASAVLKRIEAEKERLVREGEIKKREVFQTIEDDELPFSIPNGWCAMRMGWLARKLGAGSTPLGGKSVYQDEGIPFLRSQNIHDDGLKLEDVALITRTVHDRMSGTHVQDQDILLNITGASIGRCALVPNGFGEGNVSQHVAIIRLFLPAIREFIHLLLISPRYQKLIMDVQVGVSREGLSMQRLRLFPMLVPPLAEQHRIVARVNELMALCDELEAAQQKRERRRDRLVAATLSGLNDGEASSETHEHPGFEEIARFYFNHLPRLTTRPEHIHQLRKTILNLAVRGKLVPQNPGEVDRGLGHSGPPGSDIRKRSARLDASRHWLFELPASWNWHRIEELATQVTDGEHATPQRIMEKQVPLVTAKNVRDGQMDYTNTDWVSYETATRAWQRCRPQVGDILLVCVGATTGRLCVIQNSKDMVLVRSVALIRPNNTISADFFALVLRSPIGQMQIWDNVKVTAQPCLYINRIKSLAIPRPTLAEQNRIVAKVDEMMRLCDELEARLSGNATTRERLLDAIPEEALKGAV